MKAAKSRDWKAMLKQHDILAKKGKIYLRDRVLVLRDVFRNPAYLAEMKATGKSQTALLDTRVSDTCANFTELLRILAKFPRKEQWENGNLLDMKTEAMKDFIKANGSKKKANGKMGSVHQRKSATVAELREKDSKIEKLETEIEHMKEVMADKDKMISGLERSLATAHRTIDNLNDTIGSLKGGRRRQTAAA